MSKLQFSMGQPALSFDPSAANTVEEETDLAIDPATNLMIETNGLTKDLAAESDFIRLEKNLASLGFFTPGSKSTKKPIAKTVHFTRLVGGKRMTASVSIAPSVLSTLPTTADQDKYLAFQKILLDRRETGAAIQNPVAFTSAELLRQLGGRSDAGKNYRDIAQWLQVMTATTIVSQGAVYFSGTRAWASDTFHVFDRAISVGRTLPDGRVADKNYVWLSEWQLQNINDNHLLPIDFETYKKLRNHIAKALVPLLQIWLFASESTQLFEKRYDELCEHLHITEYRYLSKIREKLAPALDELVTHGYLREWDIQASADGRGYKVAFVHGTKYFRDKARRLSGPELPSLRNLPGMKPGAEAAAPAALPLAHNAPKTPQDAPDRPSEGSSPLPAQKAVQKTSKEVSEGVKEISEGVPAEHDRAAAQAEEVCRHFHQTLYKTGAQAVLLPVELKEAAEIVQKHGIERAKYVVDFFVRELAPKTQFRPATICGLRPHIARAVLDFDTRRSGSAGEPSLEAVALAGARRRHITAFQGAYEDYRRKTLVRLQEGQPEAYQSFCTQEAAQREKAGAELRYEVRSVTLRHFDRVERHLDRAWAFFAAHKDWGILTFWEWDAAENANSFNPGTVTRKSALPSATE